MRWRTDLAVLAALVCVLAAVVAYRASRGESRAEFALATNPISLYVMRDGKLEERRSGVAPVWSPDGRHLAYVGDHDGKVWVDDRAYALGVAVDGSVTDSRRLAFYVSGDATGMSGPSRTILRVFALEVATGEIRRVAELTDAANAKLAWNA